VQETFRRFLEAFPDELPPESCCTGWLMTTLTHLIFDDGRKRSVQRRTLANLSVLPFPLADPGTEPPAKATPMSTVMDKITDKDFKAAVESLSLTLRIPYELHVLGFSHAEIAAKLGLAAGTLRKRLHDARQHLRKRLQMDLAGEVR